MGDEHHDKSARLSLETIRSLIAAEDEDVQVDGVEEAPGSGRGDNYTSMLYRLNVRGRRRTNGSSWSRCIIYKVLPESRERRDTYKSEVLFRNEVVFYTKVWPALDALQKRVAAPAPVFDGVAKVYLARNDLIAMEDLRPKGYGMADRTKGLHVDKLERVLKALAGFHALSLTLKDLRPELFARLSGESSSEEGECVQEAMFRMENAEWYRQYYRTATSNALKMVSEGLPSSLESRREEILGKFRAYLDEDSFFRTMCELTSTQGPLTVFCHGDCWTNNFLFQEQQEAADPHAVCLVDFQLTRVGSLALDLANLFYCCTSGETRRKFMTQLLQYYHRNLMSALYTLNPAAEATKDPSAMWKLLVEEMRRCSRFGLGLALDMLPISTCQSDEAPDLYEGKQQRADEERSVLPPAGAECTRLMTELVIEFIDNKAL